jgi:small subunit ribosomal protein S13
MARISGVTIPNDKQVWVALTYVYGIGQKSSYDILERAKVEPTERVKNLNDGEVSRIQEIINADFLVEGELQRIVSSNIKRLKDIKAYRGLRHTASLLNEDWLPRPTLVPEVLIKRLLVVLLRR